MRGYACIGLVNPKNPINVGAVLRASGCYEVGLVVVSGKRPSKYFGRIPTDTQKAYRHIPVLRTENIKDGLPYDCVPIAIDITDAAEPLMNFVHPERAMYIFGAEDMTLGKEITKWCKHTLYIPTVYCMNLAATVNVVLYDRMNKGGLNAKDSIL